ncbi:MAG: transglutaminase family protein [Herpetosiphonaceae bacterium]|nr:transglutaminase family protein [Herpetosiphonaceae bacterium]
MQQFIDHRQIEWQRVKRTNYFLYQCFRYEYPGPIADLRQNLMVVPAKRYGDQRLRDHQLIVSPHKAATSRRRDCCGNHVLALDVARVERSIAFEVMTTVERNAQQYSLPTIPRAAAAYFLEPTRLTRSDEHITAIAHELRAKARRDEDLALAIHEWVGQALRYGSGATTVLTTAAEALAIGQGLCQDYAHVMLAICRAAGMPARYVSGHMLGEGGSHAWVEVLLPARRSGRLQAVAYDSTNQRQPNLGYTTVAIGRDYADVAPTSGRYTAPYGGRLSFTKRAGLTEIEYLDGYIVRSATCAPDVDSR